VKALAIACWVAAWTCSGLIVAAWFAARGGKAGIARAELAAGLLGAAGFALIGWWAW
jgi:hypothetical protein